MQIPEWVRHPDAWEMIPEACQVGLDLYLRRGVPPGAFLEAVVANDLVAAFGRADETNARLLRHYAAIIYTSFPTRPLAWGPEKAWKTWCSLDGLDGIQREEGWNLSELKLDQSVVIRAAGGTIHE